MPRKANNAAGKGKVNPSAYSQMISVYVLAAGGFFCAVMLKYYPALMPTSCMFQCVTWQTVLPPPAPRCVFHLHVSSELFSNSTAILALRLWFICEESGCNMLEGAQNRRYLQTRANIIQVTQSSSGMQLFSTHLPSSPTDSPSCRKKGFALSYV